MSDKIDNQNKRFVISVLALDRVGIIQCISSAVADLGGNIDGLSQTVIHGYFTIILTAAFAKPHSPDAICDAVSRNFDPNEASVVVRPFEVKTVSSPVRCERYFITLTGHDRPGILKKVTAYLAGNRINIEDYFFTIQGDRVTHIGEVSIPVELDIKQLSGELQALVSSLDLVATLQHENLFRAANDIFAIRALFKKEPCEK